MSANLSKYLLKNGHIFTDGKVIRSDLMVDGDTVCFVAPSFSKGISFPCYDISGCIVFPGFTDVHVHFREPGFSYKETIESGSLAAAHGGYTSVCTMPNLSPVPDSLENLDIQLQLIKKDGKINIYPYGSITKLEAGLEISELEEMSPYVIGFSDDGRGVQDPSVMLEAMKRAAKLKKPVVAHCEDNSLLFGGYIHDGEYAKAHSHKGICSESEWGPIKRDIQLVKESGCKYHVCHISCKESVELIRQAKAQGVDITCETGPHYLILDDSCLKEEGRFKMNPPLRSKEDRLALIEGIKDGTIDMIATDHAPHSAKEKSLGLEKSLMGVVGLESAFALLYTYLVKEGVITLERLIELLNLSAQKRFGIGSPLYDGCKADFTVFNLDEKYIIDPKDFLSKGKSTPFEGFEVFGKCKLTTVGGKIIWQDNLTEN